MRIVNPIGSPRVAPLLCRLTLGFYLFLTGVWGFSDPKDFSLTVEVYAGTANGFFNNYAIVAPYLAVVSGALIMLGLFTTGAALIASCLLLPLAIAAGVFSQGAGAFSPYIENRILFRDAVLLGVSVSLLFSGPGMCSVDELLQAIYEPKKGP